MQIRQNGEKLILRDSIFVVWSVCLIAVIGGIWQFVHYFNVWKSGELTIIALAVSAFIGLVFCLAGIIFLAIFPATTFMLDRSRQIVVVRTTGLFGRKTSEFRFTDVREFVVAEDDDNDGGRVWRAEMVLESGERIPLSSGFDAHLETWKAAQTTANKFLKKRMVVD